MTLPTDGRPTTAPTDARATTAPTDRTRLRRKPARGSHERAVIDAILDEALVCHVAFPGDAMHGAVSGPVVIPTTHVRIGDELYLHGSAASRMLKTLAGGVEVCVAVTLLDGIVLARAAMHHSVNYRSVILFGRARAVEERTEKLAALAALVDHAVPGRSAACRPPNAKELTATLVIALPIAEASAKTRSGPPLPDDDDDAVLPYWAGVIPLHTVRGTPMNAPACDLPPPVFGR
jgi:nitroimidazol reductase NimA-like FMN-containing flavoprotein (pyridoxamine 5'-phosphate oxidase superfamily)